MTPVPASDSGGVREDETDLFELFATLLRWRWRIMALAFTGAVIGIAAGLLKTRVYTARTTFIPQGVEGQSAAGLAVAASQFGFRLPGGSAAWGPPIYVELLKSRALLAPVAMDTVVVAEEGGSRMQIADLLKVPPGPAAVREESAAGALAKVVNPTEAKALGGVSLAVTTKWPSVSYAIAQRLLTRVNEFNVKTRKSQAGAERAFVEQQAAQADAELRDAERRQLEFLQRNRAIESAALATERDRLQRMVALRTQVYTSLLQNLEEARMREVRDTPVITIIEEPRVPIVGDRRGTFTKMILGGFAGAILGIVLAVAAQALRSARRVQSEEAREFFREASAVIPRFLRRESAR